MVEALAEIERLAGDQIQRRGRWSELARHRHFALGVDLHDIAQHDWPSVREDLEAALYTELEPLPTDGTDLSALVQAAPVGAVATRLAWNNLDDDGFERLVFNLIDSAPEYENPRWDTRTRAADGSRDLEVDRVTQDTLAGTRRERVILQCKHWTTKSIAPTDVLRALSDVRTHWEPPGVDLLVVVTTGRFTSDAVKTIQAHNQRGDRPRIEWWAESRLESLLSTRTRLVTELGLRDSPSRVRATNLLGPVRCPAPHLGRASAFAWMRACRRPSHTRPLRTSSRSGPRSTEGLRCIGTTFARYISTERSSNTGALATRDME